MKTLTMTAGAVIASVITGCATAPPQELKNARSAFQDAAQSPGANLAQADVYEAKKSLDRAETQFHNEGDDAAARDLAYVAERKAIIAKSKGNTALSIQQRDMALAEADRIKQEKARAAREQLGQTKEQLSQTQSQLASERAARTAADEALSKIKGLQTKQDARGLVVTLSGSVLFAFGKSELLPGSQKRLDEVVVALKEDKRPLTIIGHTDSVGSDDVNMNLSQKRAESVRNYLISRGIGEDRVDARGVGKTEPIADNKTAEGRANNRRVEIILRAPISPEGRPMPGTGTTPQNNPGTMPGNTP